MVSTEYYSGVILRAMILPGKKSEYYKLGIKTDDGKRILITLNPRELGWNGILQHSKIYYYRPGSHRIIKTTMSNPEKYIGTRVKVKGELHSINLDQKKFKLSPLQELILYLE